MPEIPYQPPKRSTLWHVLNGMTGGMVGFGGGYYADRAAYDRKHEEAVRAQHQLDHDNRLAQRMKEQREAEVMDRLKLDYANLGGVPKPGANQADLLSGIANLENLGRMQKAADDHAADEQAAYRAMASANATAQRMMDINNHQEATRELERRAKLHREFQELHPFVTDNEVWNYTEGQMMAAIRQAADDRRVAVARKIAEAELEAKNEQANKQDIKDYTSFFAVPPTLDSKGRLTPTELKKLEDERERRRLSARDNRFSNLFDDDGKWTPGRPGAGGGTGTPGRPGAGGTNAPANTRVTEWVRDPKTGVLTPKR